MLQKEVSETQLRVLGHEHPTYLTYQVNLSISLSEQSTLEGCVPLLLFTPHMVATAKVWCSGLHLPGIYAQDRAEQKKILCS